MGKHVDTTRPEDAGVGVHDTPSDWPGPARHRKPGSPMVTFGVASDVWSGDPDTDRAWRDRDEEDAQRYHFPVDEYKYM